MIKFKMGGIEYECETAEEVVELQGELRGAQPRTIRAMLVGGPIGTSAAKSPWTAKLFQQFIETLGEPQKEILSLMITAGPVPDDIARMCLDLENNQQLAGVLSGISKQAAALDIPARAVFKIEKESKSGKTTTEYIVSREFLVMANEMNWPDTEE